MSVDARPIVALCLPAGDEVKTEFAMSLAAMAYSSGGARLILSRGSSSIVTNARGACVDQVLTTEQVTGRRADWLLWIDSDMQFPPDLIFRLIARGQPIVGAAYVRRAAPYDVMAKTLTGKPVEQDSGLLEVEALPMGCMLVAREIFDRMVKPWFRLEFDEKTGETWGEDIVFCRQVRGMGYKVMCDIDLSQEVGHVGTHVFRTPAPEKKASPLILPPRLTGRPHLDA